MIYEDKTAFVDFDGTICPNKGRETESNKYELIPPTPKCIEVLTRLRSNGYKIIVFSVRSHKYGEHREHLHTDMVDYLNKYNVPYDDFFTHKPNYKVLIDDKAAGCPLDSERNVEWEKVQEDLVLNNII